MANRVKLNCWPSPDFLVIGIQLKNLAGRLHSEVEELFLVPPFARSQILFGNACLDALHHTIVQRSALRKAFPNRVWEREKLVY